MKLFKSAYISLALVSVALFASSATYAGYRVTPFDDGRGYRAIVSGNAQDAVNYFQNRNTNRMDFEDLNNFCVSQILVNQVRDAIPICEAALEKLSSDSSVGMLQRRKASALIHSNLGVARAQNGDLVGANIDFETALTFDSRHEYATINIEEVRLNMVAGN